MRISEKAWAAEEISDVASLASGMGFAVYAEERGRAPCVRPNASALFPCLRPRAEAVRRSEATARCWTRRTGGGRTGPAAHGVEYRFAGYLTSVEEHQFGDALQQLRETGMT